MLNQLLSIVEFNFILKLNELCFFVFGHYDIVNNTTSSTSKHKFYYSLNNFIHNKIKITNIQQSQKKYQSGYVRW